MPRFRILVVVAVILAVGAACKPRPSPAPATTLPPVCWKTPDRPALPERQAVLEAFARHGQGAVDHAGQEACCESSYGPFARNGQFLGMFQNGRDSYGTMMFWSEKFGYPRGWMAWYDARVSAHTAQSSYVQRGDFSAYTCYPG